MPFVPIPNTAKCELVYSVDAIIAQNVLHFEYATGPGTPELTNLSNDLIAWWTTNLAPLVSTGCTLTAVIAADQTAQNAEAVEVAASVPGTIASGTSQLLPQNVTAAVKHSTGLRGRSYRGRSYQVGMVESQVDAGLLTVAFQNALQAAWETLITYAWTDTGWTWVVASRFEDNAPRVTGLTTPVINTSVDRYVDSQRRRLRGRGQ